MPLTTFFAVLATISIPFLTALRIGALNCLMILPANIATGASGGNVVETHFTPKLTTLSIPLSIILSATKLVTATATLSMAFSAASSGVII